MEELPQLITRTLDGAKGGPSPGYTWHGCDNVRTDHLFFASWAFAASMTIAACEAKSFQKILEWCGSPKRPHANHLACGTGILGPPKGGGLFH